MFGLPNLLTLSRIFLIPIVIGLFYLNRDIGHYIAAILFVLACITDYLDGYVARAYQQITPFGRFLDPLADKLLICSTLLLLSGFDHIRGLTLIPAIVILCREILVSGLREFLSETKYSLPVTLLAKWKTTLQMGALALLIIATPTSPYPWIEWLGDGGLWIAALLSCLTGYQYVQKGLEAISHSENAPSL